MTFKNNGIDAKLIIINLTKLTIDNVLFFNFNFFMLLNQNDLYAVRSIE